MLTFFPFLVPIHIFIASLIILFDTNTDSSTHWSIYQSTNDISESYHNKSLLAITEEIWIRSHVIYLYFSDLEGRSYLQDLGVYK